MLSGQLQGFLCSGVPALPPSCGKNPSPMCPRKGGVSPVGSPVFRLSESGSRNRQPSRALQLWGSGHERPLWPLQDRLPRFEPSHSGLFPWQAKDRQNQTGLASKAGSPRPRILSIGHLHIPGLPSIFILGVPSSMYGVSAPFSSLEIHQG